MLKNLRRQSVSITTFKEQLSQKEEEEEQKTVKPCKPCGMSKEDHGQLINNYVRLVAELPTSDIADYLKKNQILTEEMVVTNLYKETLLNFIVFS
jgi:hypothetical protein